MRRALNEFDGRRVHDMGIEPLEVANNCGQNASTVDET